MIDNKQVKEILLKGDYVSLEDITKAEAFAKKRNSSIVEYLLAEELISKDLLGQAMAEFFKVPYADLNSNQPSHEQALKIPENKAKKYRIVLFKEKEKETIVTTDNPKKAGLLQVVKEIFKGKKISLAYSLSEDIEAVFTNYRKTLETRFSQIIKSQKKIAPEIIDEIIKEALTYKASDIHFEPRENEAIIRFRIDGVLQDAGSVPKEYYRNILNRIKIQANLRIDEHSATQDGAIRFNKDGSIIDMRVSVAPTIEGEKVVIRILSQHIRGLVLSDLGLSNEHQERMLAVARKPFGMILTTGPTGSGKTTTLYAFLKLLNRPEVNITTIEDPIEYRITEANQIQVNKEANLTFSQGLRSIVRQDPDIILVGEIRDKETVEIAVNAALTGHLLLSTFHANDAATAIPRLLDMGVEPFLLASTLEVVAAQRLARRLCEHCRYSYTESISNLEKLAPGIKKYFSKKKTLTLYKGKGCPACGNIGYKGRVGIFEVIIITPELEELILQKPSARQVWELASKQGAKSLFEDGIEKLKNGATSLDELLRVVALPN